MTTINNDTVISLIDTRSNSVSLLLPSTSNIRNRALLFKDIYGTFSVNNFTIQTIGDDLFQDNTNEFVVDTDNAFVTISADTSNNKWNILSIADDSGANWYKYVAKGGVTINNQTNVLSLDVSGKTVLSNTSNYLSVKRELVHYSNFIVSFASENTNANSGVYFYNQGNSSITPTSNTNSEVDISYNGSLWVAVGKSNGSSSSISYSSNGISWTNATTQFGVEGRGVTYGSNNGSNIWVAVGDNGDGYNIFYSYDGTNWTNNTSASFSGALYSVLYNSAQSNWLIAGYISGGGIALMSDPTSGSITTPSSGGFDSYGVYTAYNGSNLWVAVGSSTTYNDIQYSSDCINWTAGNNVTYATDTFFTDSNVHFGASVAYGNGIWIAVGYDSGYSNSIYSSTDGVNFSLINSSVLDSIVDIKYVYGDTWVMTNYLNQILYSTDNGSNWTAISLVDAPYYINDSISVQTMSHIVYTSNYIYTSNVQPALEVYGDVNIHGTLNFIDQSIIGSDIQVSTIHAAYFIGDGSKLINITGGGGGDPELSTLSSIIAFGFSTISTTYGQIFNTSTLTANNANISSIATSSITLGTSVGFLQTTALQAIAVSSIQTNAFILNANFTNLTSISSVTIQSSNILTTNITTNLLVATSNITTPAILNSAGTNIINLNYAPFSGGPTPITLISSVVTNYTNFNAIGNQGQQQFLINTNLVTPTTGMYLYATGAATPLIYNFSPTASFFTVPMTVNTVATCLANNGNIMLQSRTNGQNPFTFSYDGLMWYPGTAAINASGNINAFAYNGSNLWVALGNNGNIATSPNGITWTSRTTPFNGTSAGGLAYNGSLWVAGGGSNPNASNTLAYSTDAITWTAIASGGFSNGGCGGGQSIGWNGSYWVAVGQTGLNVGAGATTNTSNAVLYSFNGSNWFNSRTVPATFLTGRTVAWSPTLNIWAAGGAGTPANSSNNLIWSTDGSNWSNAISVIGTGPNTQVNAIIWDGSLFVAGGATSGTGCLVTSSDGRNWVTNSNFTGFNINSITYDAFMNTNIQVSSFTATAATISSATVSSIRYGTGPGFVNFTALQAIAVSTIQINAGFVNTTTISSVNANITSSLVVSSILTAGLQVGASSNTRIFFAGFSNTYSRTVIAEQSNAPTSQELLLYKGGTSADQIRAQTTGSISLEAGVAARTWPTNTNAGANPSLFINGTPGIGLTQIGINTNAPATGVTLDVTLQAGTAQIRAPQMSSLQVFTSSILATVGQFSTINSLSISTGVINLPAYSFSSIFAQTVSAGILNISSLNTNVLSTNTFAVSTLNVNFISSAQATFSSLIVNAMQFGAGDGFVDFGAVRSVVVSSIQTNTGLATATQMQASTISATLFPVYYNTIISTVNTGNTMFLPTSASGSYVFITSAAASGSVVSVSLPTTSVPTGSLFVIKHKGQTGGTNTVNIVNTASVLAASTTTTAVYSGTEWMSLGISGVA